MPITPVNLGNVAIDGKKLVFKSSLSNASGQASFTCNELKTVENVLALAFKSGSDCCVQGCAVSGKTVTVTVKTVAGTPAAVSGATVYLLAVGVPE